MKRWLSIFCFMCLTLAFQTNAQTDVTHTMSPMQSVFDYDICAPPCWMGLIPGESTSADVERMLAENADLIDPLTIDSGASRSRTGEYAIDPVAGLIIQGGFSFDIGERTQPHQPGEARSGVSIAQGVLDRLTVLSFDPISLQTILERLGNPDLVRLSKPAGVSHLSFKLVYLEEYVYLVVRAEAELCRTSNLQDEMLFFVMLYFSPQAAQRVEQRTPELPAQPALTAYRSVEDRPVPSETWNAWMNGEVDLSCAEAWETLPEAPVQPLSETNAQTDVTPTMSPIQSIFDYDICAPPCWMGLIPGESTSDDVERMFAQYPDLFDYRTTYGGAYRSVLGEPEIDPETGLIIRGGFSFDVGTRVQSREPEELTSRLSIVDGVVEGIRVISFDIIPLETVLNRLGTPDIVRLNVPAERDFAYLKLIYLEKSLYVMMRVLSGECHIATLQDEMLLFTMSYFAPGVAERVEYNTRDMPPYPDVSVYWSLGERPVPLETWETWMNGEIDLSCAEAWETLP